ncbi:unnamed protein product [Trichobilharzia regenti]|nr:unnamed protein product [Trichobilharzia regenti]
MTFPVIMSTNCRSLENKINYLNALLCSNIYRNTGVITLQVTWLHNTYDENLFSLNDFTMYKQDRSSSWKKRGAGVANFIRGLLPTTTASNPEIIKLNVYLFNPYKDSKQFAYKRRRITLDAAEVLHHNIVSSLDKGVKFVHCAFLDYTCSFDLVSRDILLNKLSETQTEILYATEDYSNTSGNTEQENG